MKTILNDDIKTLNKYVVNLSDNHFKDIISKYGNKLSIEDMLSIIDDLMFENDFLEKKVVSLNEEVSDLSGNVNPYSFYGINENNFH